MCAGFPIMFNNQIALRVSKASLDCKRQIMKSFRLDTYNAIIGYE